MFLNDFNPWCLLKWGGSLPILRIGQISTNFTFIIYYDKKIIGPFLSHLTNRAGKILESLICFFPSQPLPSFSQWRIIALFQRSMYITCAYYWCGFIGIWERWDGETQGWKEYPWCQDVGGTSVNCKVQYISDEISRELGQLGQEEDYNMDGTGLTFSQFVSETFVLANL